MYTAILNVVYECEANFDMRRTGLTLGGFIQPGIAKNMQAMLRKACAKDSYGLFLNQILSHLLNWKK